ncbi:MAG: hypothetical protein Tsb009_35660 [Planctomycetaceae bacterium]
MNSSNFQHLSPEEARSRNVYGIHLIAALAMFLLTATTYEPLDRIWPPPHGCEQWAVYWPAYAWFFVLSILGMIFRWGFVVPSVLLGIAMTLPMTIPFFLFTAWFLSIVVIGTLLERYWSFRTLAVFSVGLFLISGYFILQLSSGVHRAPIGNPWDVFWGEVTTVLFGAFMGAVMGVVLEVIHLEDRSKNESEAVSRESKSSEVSNPLCEV